MKSRIENKEWLAKLRRMPCLACGSDSAGYAHHLRYGVGMGQKSGDDKAIPLCWSCHQGPGGIHMDPKGFKSNYGTDLELLDELKKYLVDSSIPWPF